MKERQMLRAAVALGVMCGCGVALVTGFHVEPVKASWSGHTDTIPPNNYVSQVLTINFDELDSATGSYCELFAGTQGGGGAYHVSVRTYPGDVEIASGNAGGNVNHRWVKFNLAVDLPESIVKGKKLEFRFARTGSDSLHYYYDTACGYDYGQMIAPYRYGLLTTALMLVQAV